MDGISAATTVLAVIQTTWQVYTLCQAYYTEVKNARKDIQSLRQEVMSLEDILTNVSDLTKEDDLASLLSVRLLTQDGGPLQQCKELLEQLVAKLDPGKGKTLMKQFGMRALKWPLNSKDVAELFKKIEKHKVTFNIALAADNVGLSQTIKGGVAKLNDGLAEMKVEQRNFNGDARWKSIYQWLSPPDPSLNHNTACSKHQLTTGAWFLDSEEFTKWKTSSNSFLWLHGIPGCGKTILSSTIIEDITEQWKSDPNIAIIYFYFDFQENEKQQSKNFVRSIIVQLSMQCPTTPDSLDALFSRNQNGLKQPAINALMATLQQILGDFQQVFIVIDALDECEDREDLLGLVETIFNWKLEKLHILATSRRERDIEESLELLVTDQILIQGKSINSDIRTYISERLKKDPKLRKWPANVKTDIEDTLMTQADGMFRWVVCQLDSLKKCLKPGVLRKALKSLPADLNETYDRILDGIDKDYIEDAFKILQWLVHSTRPLDLAEVAEVVAVGLDNEPEFDPESRLGEPLDVLTICSSLVTTVSRKNSEYDGHVYEKPEVRLAHFSVKEYLVTARIQRENTTYTVEKDDQGCVAQTCLAYLLHLTEPAMLTPSYLDDFPLAEYAANYWFIHAKAAKRDVDKINKLGFRLCHSHGTYINWIRLRDLDGYELGDHELSNRDIDRFIRLAPPLYYAALAGLVDLSRYLLENGADANANGGMYDYALQAASVLGYSAVVDLLLEHGAYINAKGGTYCTALHAACYRGHEDIVRTLLDHGANADIKDKYHNTALRVAHNKNQEAVIAVVYEMRPDLKNEYLKVQLRETAFKGQLTSVKRLQGDEVNTNAKCGQNNSALQAASSNGQNQAVKLLVDNKTDVNLKGGKHDSALQVAPPYGDGQKVKLLLENDAVVNHKSGRDDTPLQAACARGKVAAVKLLIESGADVNSRGGESGSPLLAAASEGHEEVVKLLLENGADINICLTSLYPTALAAAAFAGSETIVGLLLEQGIDIKYCSGAILSVADGATVLPFGQHELAWCNIVKLMHEKGAEFTPHIFSKVCKSGSEAVVKLMFEIGLDFTPSADYYIKTIATVAQAESFEMIFRTEAEVSKRGYKAITNLLQEKIDSLSG